MNEEKEELAVKEGGLTYEDYARLSAPSGV